MLTATSSARHGCAVTSHSVAVIGNQKTNSAARQMLLATTYVDRSTAGGTNVVHQRLNPARAITLC